MGAATAIANGDVLSLAGVLDFDSVVELRPVGRDWLLAAGAATRRLDLAGVTHSSSAGLALLLDWMRVAGGVDKTLRIENMPAYMLALARISGLDALLPRG